MAFVVKKTINGKEYFYLNENKRIDGKVKTKTLAYLGKNKKEAKEKAEEIMKDKNPLEKNKKQESSDKKMEAEKKKDAVAPLPSGKKELESGKKEVEKDFISFLQEGGFIWGPEPEIYGGFSGFYTYGPIGKLLKNKVENSVRN